MLIQADWHGVKLSCAGLRKTSERLAGADKGVKLLTRELEHGGLQRRLNGPEATKSGRQRSPYSPWLAQPYLKAIQPPWILKQGSEWRQSPPSQEQCCRSTLWPAQVYCCQRQSKDALLAEISSWAAPEGSCHFE